MSWLTGLIQRYVSIFHSCKLFSWLSSWFLWIFFPPVLRLSVNMPQQQCALPFTAVSLSLPAFQTAKNQTLINPGPKSVSPLLCPTFTSHLKGWCKTVWSQCPRAFELVFGESLCSWGHLSNKWKSIPIPFIAIPCNFLAQINSLFLTKRMGLYARGSCTSINVPYFALQK